MSRPVRAGWQRLEQSLEAQRGAKTGGEFKPIQRGWCLGEETFRRELLAHKSERTGAEHSGEERAQTAKAMAEQIIAEELKRRRWQEIELPTGNLSRRFFPADLTGIFLGSEGVFGVITEASLKIYRQPEVSLTKIACFPDVQAAVNALRSFQQAQRGGGISTLVETASCTQGNAPGRDFQDEGSISTACQLLLVLRAEGDRTDVQRHMARACDLCREQG